LWALTAAGAEERGCATVSTWKSAHPYHDHNQAKLRDTNAGASVYLDFDKPRARHNPDELKRYLSGLLDFSKQHSAAVQWIETLPPEIQTRSWTAGRVGMDHEMVLAAIGRPDRKVREKEPDGTETEDWIYGKPPAKTLS